MSKTLYSFDFDDTLCHTPDHIEGKKQWEKITGLSWPYNGWWGKAETLDSDVFSVQKNEWVYQRYLDAVADEDAYLIMATGRLKKIVGMRENIDKIFEKNGLEFDEVHLNWGSDTLKFKIKLFEEKIEALGVEEFIMFDDRQEHLPEFEKWADEQDIRVTVIDVVNKTTKVFEKSKI